MSVARRPAKTGLVSARGNGKVILLGEHAVVHGVPALAAGLSLGASALARPAPAARLAVSPWGLEARPGDGSPLGAAFAALLEARGAAPERAQGAEQMVEAVVELPSEGGLGSSAALAVATLRALDRAEGIARDFEGSQAVALAWERVFHGEPSGIDTALALEGGLVRYRRALGEAPARRDALRAKALVLVVASSGERGETRRTVAHVAALRTREPDAFRASLRVFEDVVAEGERALVEGELEALGAALDRAQALLRGWGVSTPRLDRMCELSREAGALGAKLTGGGGGGCMIALAPDAPTRARVRAALAARGFSSFEATIGGSSSALEVR